LKLLHLVKMKPGIFGDRCVRRRRHGTHTFSQSHPGFHG
jgi:hypothetical protein